MNIKDYIILLFSLLFFGMTHGLTYKVTRDKTITEVVDNITYFCYNSKGGAILEGSNGVYVLCQGVRIEEVPQQQTDRRNEV